MLLCALITKTRRQLKDIIYTVPVTFAVSDPLLPSTLALQYQVVGCEDTISCSKPTGPKGLQYTAGNMTKLTKLCHSTHYGQVAHQYVTSHELRGSTKHSNNIEQEFSASSTT
ncbi:hypothetical protein NP493_624g01040 [Ridgeia piscesae]|uniref:Uncharacterized protein n=1 Tax=Ridgeia piscesae TaxID=27915 RepID=A0AAD9KT63_RIDPI|nr:hypothetical protein NP493_624g01040 [Ridgeia piscesae]